MKYHVGITRMDWSGAVLHMEVSEVDSASLGWDNYTAEMAEVSAREDTGSPWGQPYRGRIHMWDHPKGNHYTRAPSPAQGLTLGKHTSAGPGVWRSATPEGAGGTSTGFAVGNWTEKQLRRTYPVRRVEWRSKRDWHRAVFQCYWPSKASTREDTGSTRRL